MIVIGRMIVDFTYRPVFDPAANGIMWRFFIVGVGTSLERSFWRSGHSCNLLRIASVYNTDCDTIEIKAGFSQMEWLEYGCWPVESLMDHGS